MKLETEMLQLKPPQNKEKEHVSADAKSTRATDDCKHGDGIH